MNDNFNELLEAAEQGDAKAQFILGMMYATGRGVSFDYIQAHMWLSLAELQKHARSTKERKFIIARMTRAQIIRAQELAQRKKNRLVL